MSVPHETLLSAHFLSDVIPVHVSIHSEYSGTAVKQADQPSPHPEPNVMPTSSDMELSMAPPEPPWRQIKLLVKSSVQTLFKRCLQYILVEGNWHRSFCPSLTRAPNCQRHRQQIRYRLIQRLRSILRASNQSWSEPERSPLWWLKRNSLSRLKRL